MNISEKLSSALAIVQAAKSKISNLNLQAPSSAFISQYATENLGHSAEPLPDRGSFGNYAYYDEERADFPPRVDSNNLIHVNEINETPMINQGITNSPMPNNTLNINNDSDSDRGYNTIESSEPAARQSVNFTDDDNFTTPGGIRPEFYNDTERFQSYIEDQPVVRGVEDDYTVVTVADNWEDIPEDIRNGEPGNLWGNFVDDRGNHLENTRLDSGFHLAVDEENGPVHLHFDAHDPLDGPVATFRHWNEEVRQIDNGNLHLPEKPSNDSPNWSDVKDDIHTTSVDEETGAVTHRVSNPIENTARVTVSTPDVEGATSPRTNVTTEYDANGGATTSTTVTSPTGGTYSANSNSDDNTSTGNNHSSDHKSSADERQEEADRNSAGHDNPGSDAGTDELSGYAG